MSLVSYRHASRKSVSLVLCAQFVCQFRCKATETLGERLEPMVSAFLLWLCHAHWSVPVSVVFLVSRYSSTKWAYLGGCVKACLDTFPSEGTFHLTCASCDRFYASLTLLLKGWCDCVQEHGILHPRDQGWKCRVFGGLAGIAAGEASGDRSQARPLPRIALTPRRLRIGLQSGVGFVRTKGPLMRYFSDANRPGPNGGTDTAAVFCRSGHNRKFDRVISSVRQPMEYVRAIA